MRRKPDLLAVETLGAEEVALRIFKVEEMHLRFENGQERQYRRIRGFGADTVLIVPVLDEDTFLLIREYSAGVHRYELQLPKGKVETGESFYEAANRELKEEVGMGARSLEHINTLTIAPGFMAHETQIILARDLYEERLAGDEPEEMEVVPWKFSALSELVCRQDCTEARSIAALYMVRDILAGR